MYDWTFYQAGKLKKKKMNKILVMQKLEKNDDAENLYNAEESQIGPLWDFAHSIFLFQVCFLCKYHKQGIVGVLPM